MENNFNIYVYICATESLCCTPEADIINQLYFNIFLK